MIFVKVPEPRRLKSGSWFIQLRLGGESISVTAGTAKECKRQAGLIKAEHMAGRRTGSASGGRLTLRQAIDEYIRRRENTLSPSTVDGYRRIQRNRFREVMDRKLSDLKDWQGICDREAAVCSPKTLRNSYRFVKSVLAEQGISAGRVTLPTMTPNTRLWLEPEQIVILTEQVRGTEMALPALLALHSLRRSEILALEWMDVDLKRGNLRIQGAVVPDETHAFIRKKSNKNAASTRTVPIMIPALAEALEAVPEADRRGPVITCNAHTVCNRINRACRLADLPEVGTHGLRHSFASLAYHLGMSELETMEIGGWADTATMHKIYTHLSNADRLKAENKMKQFYKNANENANKNKNPLETQGF